MIELRSEYVNNKISTHALIIHDDDFLYWDTDKHTLEMSVFNAFYSICVFEDKDFGIFNKKFNRYKETIEEVKDKLRYLYTVLVQYGLYIIENNKIVIDKASKAFKIFEMLEKLFPNVSFEIPKKLDIYVFDDCEYLVSKILESEYLTSLRGLVVFFLKGKIEYCDKDYSTDLHKEIYEEYRENKLCSVCVWQ